MKMEAVLCEVTVAEFKNSSIYMHTIFNCWFVHFSPPSIFLKLNQRKQIYEQLTATMQKIPYIKGFI